MEVIREYILSVTAASIISGILTVLLDKKGTAGAMGKMFCGVFLAITLIRPLGDLISVDDPTEMAAMRTITALMSPFYELCCAVTDWGIENSLSEPASKTYTTSFFKALSVMASQTEEGKLKELAEEMTPGGLNWQATNHLKDHDAFVHWQTALDAIMERVTGVKKQK